MVARGTFTQRPAARRSGRSASGALLSLLPFLLAAPVQAQIDPVDRRVFQAGYTLPLKDHAPIAGYAFFYDNSPDFPATNMTLRLAVVPVYLDAELGIRGALGPDTDLGLGLSGGGFADGYSEIRRGDFLPEESFTGHGFEADVSLYHRFNPAARMPLNGILRVGGRASMFERDDDTAEAFELPVNLPQFMARAGLRLGGREPYLTPTLAGEFSMWYEARLRPADVIYGFGNDRELEEVSHLFWARALLAYTFEETGRYVQLTLNAGTSLRPDRLSAYRLGGNLELTSEFPLRLPGYHAQEISAAQFVQLDASYLQPLGASRRWSAGVFGSAAGVEYLDGLEQPGNFHSGVGGAVLFRSSSGAWELGVAYAYGFQAIRDDSRGGHNLSFVVQYDLDAVHRAGERPFWNPVVGARIWRGILGAFGAGR